MADSMFCCFCCYQFSCVCSLVMIFTALSATSLPSTRVDHIHARITSLCHFHEKVAPPNNHLDVFRDSFWLKDKFTGLISSKQDTLTQCYFNAGPASATLIEHWNNIGSMYRVCWVNSLSTNMTHIRWPDVGSTSQTWRPHISFDYIPTKLRFFWSTRRISDDRPRHW